MIRTLKAERFEHVFHGGRNRPIVVRCAEEIDPSDDMREPNGSEDDSSPSSFLMVVKSAASKQLSPNGLFCELFGNILAREFGITTPAPALVVLEDDFVEQANMALVNDGIRLIPGLAVGCEYLPPFLPISPQANLKQDQFEQAVAIYAYDLLVQNPDRNRQKPNCALYKDNVIAFDFELCFSFLLPIIGSAEDWQVSKHGICKEHFFRLLIKDRKPDWAPFLSRLERLHIDRLRVIIDNLPGEWQEWGNTVCHHIENIRGKVRQFGLELQRSLL